MRDYRQLLKLAERLRAEFDGTPRQYTEIYRGDVRAIRWAEDWITAAFAERIERDVKGRTR